MTTLASMRIVFVGAVDFSRHCLERVLIAGGNVVGVLAPHPESTRANADCADLVPVSAKYGIPFCPFKRINDPELIDHIRDLLPDVIFVFGLSQLLGPGILSASRLGVIGAHPTLLPEGRGRHPLIWTLVKGLKQSGLTFFYMDSDADTGDILWQKPFSIGPDDNAADIYEKIKALAAEAIPDFLPRLAAGTAPRTSQDSARASIWPKRGEKDGEIDWARPARDIHNLVRALAKPYVGAHTFLGADKMIVWKSRLPAIAIGGYDGIAPGTVMERGPEALKVRTGDGMIELTDWQPKTHNALRATIVLGRPLS